MATDEPQYVLNTSNPRKYAEFVRLGLNYPRTSVDHPEPDSDALTVIRYKASLAGVRVIVEDTSFDIEGAAIGVNARWLSHTVGQYLGSKASLTVLIGVLEPDGLVYVYRGVTHGVIVPPTEGTSFFIDRCFKPFGAHRTFAEDKPDRLNPRAKAVQAFKHHRPFKILKPLHHHQYEGKMQHTAGLKQPLRSRPDYGTSDAALPRGDESVEEVVKRHLRKKAGYFNVGDKVLMGKWKNKHGVVKAFGQDQHGNPTVIVEPVPKGRKQDKEIQLYRIWHDRTQEAPL